MREGRQEEQGSSRGKKNGANRGEAPRPAEMGAGITAGPGCGQVPPPEGPAVQGEEAGGVGSLHASVLLYASVSSFVKRDDSGSCSIRCLEGLMGAVRTQRLEQRPGRSRRRRQTRRPWGKARLLLPASVPGYQPRPLSTSRGAVRHGHSLAAVSQIAQEAAAWTPVLKKSSAADFDSFAQWTPPANLAVRRRAGFPAALRLSFPSLPRVLPGPIALFYVRSRWKLPGTPMLHLELPRIS